MMKRFAPEELRAAGIAFGFAARLVQVEPSEDWVRQCIEEDMFDASPFGEDDEAVVEGLQLMSAWCKSAKDDVVDHTKQIQREWLRLFVGLGSPEASISESFYVEPNSSLFSKTTLSVRGAYREWGLENSRKLNEPDDSLGMMLAFCSHLLNLAADALEAGESDKADKAITALESFMVEHLLPWVSAWRFLVKQHAASAYYRGIGEFVFGLERACADRMGVAFNEEDGSFSYRG